MYNYGYYDYGYNSSSVGVGLAAVGSVLLIFWLIGMAISVFTLISMWKVYTKAGKPGWAAIVPIYNIIVMLEIAELPMWYIALFFVPFANIYAMFKIYIELAHKFGKSTAFGIGIAFFSPIFLGILAFNKNIKYVGKQETVQPKYEQPTTQEPVIPQQYEQQVNQEPVMQQQEPMVQQATISHESVQFNSNVQPVEQNQTNQFEQPVRPSFCTNCGSPLMPNASFCTNCGKQI